MRTRVARSAFGMLLGLGACHASNPGRGELEGRVYTAALDSLFAAESGARLLVVGRVHADPLLWLDHETAALPSDTALARQELERRGVTRDLASDFVAVNARRDSVRLPVVARLPVAFDTLAPLSRAEQDSLLRMARRGLGFERVRRAYPGATQVLHLSRVGLSRDQRHALVYIESACGMLCGGGALIRLSRDHGRWDVASYEWLWVS